jgi:hypothetical protein
LSRRFPIQNDLKQGKTLSPLLSNFASEYAVKKDEGNQEEKDLIRTRRHPVYADDHLLENINTIKKNTALLDTSRKIDLEVNTYVHVWST